MKSKRFGGLGGAAAVASAAITVGDQQQAQLGGVAGEGTEVVHRQASCIVGVASYVVGDTVEALAQRGDRQTCDMSPGPP
jgi:hypothetical protein